MFDGENYFFLKKKRDEYITKTQYNLNFVMKQMS